VLGQSEAASRLEELQLGAQRIASLSSQLLRIARYDATEAGEAIGLVRLDDLVREVIAGLLPLADVRAVDLGLSMPRIEVAGAESEFRVLLEILVDNAVRYAPPGGTVDVEASEMAQGNVVLSVCDDGPGVPSDVLPRLGERFFRGTRSDGEGSGLGLAIAKAIASRHDIQIKFANRKGGSGFVVTVIFRRSVPEKESAVSQGENL
jgi:two-component system OmpR family sensor kinase